MSEPRFSKGPWHIKWPVPSEDLGRKLFTADGEAIMGEELYYPWTPSNTYDWFLIATAPELYEFIETHMIGFPEADKLLAKARGEG